ncbi:MAG: CBS domain-containing protein [Desulfobulbus sp.]
MTHRNMDFDALASCLAATLLYPGATAVCPSSANPNVARFLTLHRSAFQLLPAREVRPEEVRRLIVTDTNQWQRLDHGKQLQARDDLEVLLWDHHPDDGDIQPSWRRVEQVGATITLLAQVMEERQLGLTPLQATLFLLGLYEDTGHLTFDSTTPADARAAAFLLEQGADLNIAAGFLDTAYDEVQKDVLFRLIRDAEQHTINGNRVDIAVLNLSRYAELSQVVQLYRKIVRADAVFVIFVDDAGVLFIIGRSSAPEIHVGDLLRPFGGGGHAGAGSATVSEGSLDGDEIREQLLAALDDVAETGVRVGEMMSYPVTMIPGSTPMYEVRQIMEDRKIRGLVVEEEGALAGIVVLWDLKKLRLRQQWRSPVKAFMNREVTTIGPDALAREAADLMVREDIGHLPVVHDRKVIGIVTRTDIVNYLYGMLPE